MSKQERRALRWQAQVNKATNISLTKHSIPDASRKCPGSPSTLPTDVKLVEARDSMGRLNIRIVGECPICGTIFQFNAPGQYWFIPRQKHPR